MKTQNLTAQLDRIEKILNSQALEPMNFEKACEYLSMSKSFLYKLTYKNRIPYYKPNGKKIYFEKSELNEWLLKNKVKSEHELDKIVDVF